MTLRRRLLLVFLWLTVAPIAVIVAIVGIGGHRFALDRGRAEIVACFDRLDAAIAKKLASWRFVTAEFADEVRTSRIRYESDEARRAELERKAASFFADYDEASRLFVLEEGLDHPRVIVRIAKHETESREIPLEEIPPPIRKLLGERPPPPSLQFPPATAIAPTGATVAIADMIDQADGAASVLFVYEYSIPLMLEEIHRQPAFDCFLDCVVSARDVSHPPTVVFASQPSRIGTQVDLAREEADPARGWRIGRKGLVLTASGILPSTGWRVEASISLEPIFAPLRRVAEISTLLVGVMAILAVAGIFHVTRGIGQKVERIEAAAASFVQGDTPPPLSTERDDEFGRIAEGMNRMARDLERSAEERALGRLRSRLLHDLKGVLSQMNLLLYNLRENPEDEEFRSESLDLMAGLIRNLESLTGKLDRSPGEAPLEAAPFDLDALVRSIVQRPAILSRRGIRVHLELGCRKPVKTARDAVAEAIDNLVCDCLGAMHEQGDLSVRTGELPEEAGRPPEPTHFVEVEVSGVQVAATFDLRPARRILRKIGAKFRAEFDATDGPRLRIEIGERAP